MQGGTMRTSFALLLLSFSSLALAQNEKIEALYRDVQPVYDKVVKADGTVDYAALKDQPELMKPLQAFVDYMAGFDPNTIQDKNAKIALLSNTYNIFTLVGVTEAWPVESVRKIRIAFGFFTRNVWKINGKKVSLNDIEKKMLQPLDARMHFIINCASISCPPLLADVLTAENVEAQMEAATLAFLNDSTKNQFDREAKQWRLSKIFDWYQKDWQDEAGVIAFIKKYRKDLQSWHPEDVDYIEYDWGLNGPVDRQ
jgi:hypothetical protein